MRRLCATSASVTKGANLVTATLAALMGFIPGYVVAFSSACLVDHCVTPNPRTSKSNLYIYIYMKTMNRIFKPDRGHEVDNLGCAPSQ